MAATARATGIRKRLRELVRQIPESDLYAAQRYLEFLAGQEEHPAIRALRNALIRNDEPLTEEDREQIHQAQEDVRAGRVLSHEEVCQKFLSDERP